jgi:hypothetical protein
MRDRFVGDGFPSSAPMSEQQAARVRRMMFVVVDAGRGLSGNWTNSLEGPNGVELVSAAADTAIDASGLELDGNDPAVPNGAAVTDIFLYCGYPTWKSVRLSYFDGPLCLA